VILKRLMEYELRHADQTPIGYALRTVNYSIRLTSEGTFQDIIPLAGVESRTGRTGRPMLVPYGKRSGTSPPAFLLVDDSRYVIGLENATAYHDRFVALVRECARATRCAAVEAVARWLERGERLPSNVEAELTRADVIGFEVDGVWVADLPEVRSFWATKSAAATASRVEGVTATCLVTGEQVEPVRILPMKVRGVPNTNQGLADFTSFNEAAFRSYGLEQTQNAPMSPEAARLFVNGLNRLLRDPLTHLQVQDVVYCFWTREPSDFSILTFLENPKTEDVAELLRSAQTGRRITTESGERVSPADFFVLALSGSRSRVVVRDYHETTLDSVKANLATWFRRLAIVDTDGSDARPAGIFRLAASLFREAKDIPAHVPTALLASAIMGAPLPTYLLGLAVKRNQAMQGPYSEYQGRRSLSVERLAIIKALLSQGEEDTLKGLNPEHPDAAYHCGRLLAVLERIQRAALGDINATVVDRYYGAACASPGSILGNLVNDAQAHLGKLRKERKDYHHQLRLEEVLAAIGTEFPKTLSLPRQGLFALGFYHQKAHDRAQAAEFKEMQNIEKKQGDEE
jgi:CRISPR-associated protein Csd1